MHRVYPLPWLIFKHGTQKDFPQNFCVNSDWADTLNSQLDMERFCASLVPVQQNLIQMFRDGFKIFEIADILDVSKPGARLMACEIVRQQRKLEVES